MRRNDNRIKFTATINLSNYYSHAFNGRCIPGFRQAFQLLVKMLIKCPEGLIKASAATVNRWQVINAPSPMDSYQEWLSFRNMPLHSTYSSVPIQVNTRMGSSRFVSPRCDGSLIPVPDRTHSRKWQQGGSKFLSRTNRDLSRENSHLPKQTFCRGHQKRLASLSLYVTIASYPSPTIPLQVIIERTGRLVYIHVYS